MSDLGEHEGPEEIERIDRPAVEPVEPTEPVPASA